MTKKITNKKITSEWQIFILERAAEAGALLKVFDDIRRGKYIKDMGEYIITDMDMEEALAKAYMDIKEGQDE